MPQVSIREYVHSLRPSWLSRLFSCFIKSKSKQIGLANIEHVFPNQLNDKEKQKFLYAVIDHFYKMFKELVLFNFIPKSRIKKQFEVRGEEILLEAINHGKGVFVLTGHFGNWEIASKSIVLNLQNVKQKIYCVRKEIKNKKAQKFIFNHATRFGLNIITKNKFFSEITKALKNNDIIFFPFDQHESPRGSTGIVVDFCDHKAGTYTSLATLVYYKKTPVIPLAMYRKPNGKHVIEFLPPIEWQESDTKEDTIYHNTAQYNKILEMILLRHPEQWIWFYDRWKVKV